jgi:hypothetical protein
MMKESDWRYAVDVILFICLGGMALIGILLGLVIPAGPVAAESAKFFLGLHRHQWGNIHAYLSIAFIILMVVHIVLNWKWVTAKTRQVFGRSVRPALVMTACAPVFALFLFWLGTPKDSDKYRGHGVESSGETHFQRQAAEGLNSAAGETAGTQDTPGEKESRADSAKRGDAPEEEPGRGVGTLSITGRLSLLEIERATGLSGRTIADKLGLPPAVSLSEPLGRLRQRYGFEIQAVRDIVDRMIRE